MATHPQWRSVIRLRCLACGQGRLQRPGSWWHLATACDVCHTQYAREPGYFSGAAWMIGYPLVVGVGLTSSLLWKLVLRPEASALEMTWVAAAFGSGSGAALYPYLLALWIYLDYRIHPPSQG